VPALVYGSGAAGFFALPYTILVYPIVFLLMPRLWNVCKAHNFVTPADFIGGRHGNPSLTLVVALTGILATLPYIALQLVGMQVVLASMGLGGTGLRGDVPLVIAFVILAAYTYTSGLRAPAMIAFVKDLMIYVTVIVAVVAIPVSLGGFGHIFAAADAHFKAAAAAAAAGVAAGKPPTAVGAIMLGPKGYWSYATLALGSALAAFMYPHTITGVLSSSRADVIRRNAVLLPAYTFVLGLIALLGFMAIASDLPIARPNLAIPVLFHAKFPHWFVGFAFAAIAVGALVPAAVMSIAAANLWTRNVWKAYFKPHATDAEEARCAKLASLAVKVGALGFIISSDRRVWSDRTRSARRQQQAQRREQERGRHDERPRAQERSGRDLDAFTAQRAQPEHGREGAGDREIRAEVDADRERRADPVPAVKMRDARPGEEPRR